MGDRDGLGAEFLQRDIALALLGGIGAHNEGEEGVDGSRWW